MTFVNVSSLHSSHQESSPLQQFAEKHLEAGNKQNSASMSLEKKNKKNIAANHDNVVHPVAGLDCSEHGGPSANDAQEMVYWRDIPEDNGWTSPFYKPDTRQYLTFEPDGGGWYVFFLLCMFNNQWLVNVVCV
jgi:hypothetical protein